MVVVMVTPSLSETGNSFLAILFASESSRILLSGSMMATTAFVPIFPFVSIDTLTALSEWMARDGIASDFISLRLPFGSS